MVMARITNPAVTTVSETIPEQQVSHANISDRWCRKKFSTILFLMPESGNEYMFQVLIKNIQKNVGESPANAFPQRWLEEWE
jgi:hypothetical protein